MKRLSQDEGRKASARIADESGFTMVELLATMLIAAIVLGGAAVGLSLAFKQSTYVTDRVQNTTNAEVGLQRLTQDLRQAVSCPSYTDSSGNVYYPQVTVSGGAVSTGWAKIGSGAVVALYLTSNNASTNYPVLAMCDPAAGTHATLPPQDELVVWNCEQASESCRRTWQTIPVAPSSTNNTLGATVGSTGIYGVKQLVLAGTLASSSASVQLQLNSTYALTPGITGTGGGISSVGISGQFYNLTDPANPTASANVGVLNQTSAISVNTAAELRNYGT